MTYQELKELLEATGIRFAFHHWDRPPKMPYGVYFDDHNDNFAADGAVYSTARHFLVELYERQRDEELEGRLEAVLDGVGLYWEKSSTYIDSERFWQISYEIEV